MEMSDQVHDPDLPNPGETVLTTFFFLHFWPYGFVITVILNRHKTNLRKLMATRNCFSQFCKHTFHEMQRTSSIAHLLTI